MLSNRDAWNTTRVKPTRIRSSTCSRARSCSRGPHLVAAFLAKRIVAIQLNERLSRLTGGLNDRPAAFQFLTSGTSGNGSFSASAVTDVLSRQRPQWDTQQS